VQRLADQWQARPYLRDPRWLLLRDVHVRIGARLGLRQDGHELRQVAQDDDGEGALLLDRLPTKGEAEIIRDKLGIAKRVELSEEHLVDMRERLAVVRYRRIDAPSATAPATRVAKTSLRPFFDPKYSPPESASQVATEFASQSCAAVRLAWPEATLVGPGNVDNDAESGLPDF